MSNSRSDWRSLAGGTAVAALALLTACGGGGGVGSTPSPTPTPPSTPTPTPPPPAPTPAPTPTPTPAPPTPAPTPTPTSLSYIQPPLPTDTIGFNDSEFQNSRGPRFHGAATAWVGGHTGQGTLIGVIDTGIYLSEPELAGRISPNSRDMFTSRNTVEAEDEHGTWVALTAAAANNGTGTVGIAYSSTILAIRADEPGSCASDDDCTFGDMSGAIDYAIAQNATVINMSLGGANASSAEIAAIRRASDAGIIVVISAGNDGDVDPDPFPSSIVARDFENVIIAGSVNSSGSISSFSNRAGDDREYYIAALGGNVPVSLGGDMMSISGTSFSAPQVAAAVALVKQAFPALSPAEIVDLLFETAQDVGAPGIDAIYGHGILDIRRAFQPVGMTTLADTSTAALPLGDTVAVGSPAMGDALVAASINTLVLDRYRRAFSYDFGLTARSATLSQHLYNAVGNRTRSVSAAGETATVAFTIDASRRHLGVDAVDALSLSYEDAEQAKVLAARIALQVSPKTKLGFTYAEGADGLVMQLQGQDRPAFMIARQSGSDNGAFQRSDASFALRHQLGGWGLTVSGTSGAILSGDRVHLSDEIRGLRTDDTVRHFGFAFDRDWGALEGTLGLDWMSEERTVLGGRFHDAFGGGGAETMFVDASASWEFLPGLRLAGAMRNGWTFADPSSVIQSGSTIYSRAWSLDVERKGLFGENDRIGFRVAQPLRVESGGLNLSLPVAYSYDTRSATFGVVPLSLAPDGRELMGEIAWHGPLWGGGASASIYFRREPGHYETMPDDKGVAVRWRKEF